MCSPAFCGKILFVTTHMFSNVLYFLTCLLCLYKIYFHLIFLLISPPFLNVEEYLKLFLSLKILFFFFNKKKIKCFFASTNKTPDRPETGCHKSTSTARNGLMNLLNSPSLALKQQSSSLIVIIALLDIFKEKKRHKGFHESHIWSP